MKEQSDLAVVGLGPMGSGIARNLERKGYTISVCSIEKSETDAFLQEFGSGDYRGAHSFEELCAQLRSPRKILLMLQADDAVDETLQQIVPYLAPGDVLIDGGNSYYEETQRRMVIAESAGLFYVGCGIAGGPQEALNGPSVMPGGSEAAKDLVMPVLLDLCARTDLGEACCRWMGRGGTGHFVSMAHHGIAYAEMQILCEIWDLMRKYLGMDAAMCGRTFSRWAQKTPSYLMEIAAQASQKQSEDESLPIEHIPDAAGQMDSGIWMLRAGISLGAPLSVLSEAVQARLLSAQKESRTEIAEKYGNERYRGETVSAEKRFAMLQIFQDALHAARLLAFAQGFDLLKKASDNYGWGLNLGEVAMCWRSGSVLRSSLLEDVKQAYVYDRNLPNLLLSNPVHHALRQEIPALRTVCLAALGNGIPAPCLTAALQYFNGYTSRELPADLLQGM